MKIKVCGMREAQNLEELAMLRPDYIGFIFFERSKRHVTDFPEVTLPAEIKKVGVVVNESVEFVTNLIDKYGLNGIQLHGHETPEYCEELKKSCYDGFVIFKAFSVDENFDFSNTKAYESVCDLFIFDTKGKEYGGNGVKYDWNILKNYKGTTPFLLSGGIQPEDVDNVLSFLRSQESQKCVGLDLNSGFEDAPGHKNIEKLKRFIKEIKV